MSDDKAARVVAVVRGVESSDAVARGRGQQVAALNAWVGRWLNDGYTINGDGSRGATITTSDVYEWAPGGFFVVHTAYGQIGEMNVGGTEIIGYDEESGDYISYFFDSQGNTSKSQLSVEGDTWTFHGDTTRATVIMSDANPVQTVLHERTDDEENYVASMRVVLTKVD
jgi:hypothetical protein